MEAPHPFAKFVAILGRGKTKQRHLTVEESREAMGMILRGETMPEQTGAFLMLLRLKEEAPEEIAGFAMSTREEFDLPTEVPHVDIDWSSYAGKRIQLPWFLLSALTLVGAGFRVFMHGTDGHTPGRVYTRETLERLGFPIATDLTEAAEHIRENRFAYTPLQVLSPKLQDLIQLRPIFGLRSPVHSFSRMLNPFDAPVMMQGIFHRGFMDIHAGAARLVKQPHMAVFRGEGGEIERRPNKPTLVYTTSGDNEPVSETWPALLSEAHQPSDTEMNVDNLIAIWRGQDTSEYATAAITGTVAIALKTMGKAETVKTAQDMATQMWHDRDLDALPVT
jgi:anthranilate phosphoribosyltransferase